MDDMQIIDSHCHPQLAQYDADRDEMIARAFGAGVGMICIGVDFETSRQGIELAQKHERMWAAVGLHPNDNLNEVFDPTQYEALLKMPKVVGMGEIGLDYYRTPDSNDQAVQKKRFEEQLALGVRMNMPIVLHSRDAAKGSTGRVHADMIAILKNNPPLRGGIAHSFTGSIDEVRQYLDLGFYIGFNGILTFARQYDEMVKFIPLDRILLETDAPFLAPEPHRGQRNEPVYVMEVARKLAELKDEPLEKIIVQTTENTRKVFQI
ncbi:MAG TPA: TatD family hydrolase [Candidatus Paceibacterota bacterium]|nr:TatD family hydrolase [Candidatus Paceibacterota bacterium]